MKTLISIIVIMFAVGCGKSDIQRLEEKNKKLEAELKEEKHKLDTAKRNKKLKEDLLKLSVVDSYEAKVEERTFKHVFLENGKVVHLNNGEKIEGTWKLVEKEVHVVEEGTSLTAVFKIEQNGDLTCIAYIENGKRTDIPKEVQVLTFIKVK